MPSFPEIILEIFPEVSASRMILAHQFTHKIINAKVRQGKNERKSGMYTLAHEHFEFVFNAVSASRMILAHQI